MAFIAMVVQAEALAASGLGYERTVHTLNVDTGRVPGAHVWQQQQNTESSSPLTCLNNYTAFTEARVLANAFQIVNCEGRFLSQNTTKCQDPSPLQ